MEKPGAYMEMLSLGVDIRSGTVPSKMQMLGLFMKPGIRNSAVNIFTAFKDAGVDLNSKVNLQPRLNMHVILIPGLSSSVTQDMIEAFMSMKKNSEGSN